MELMRTMTGPADTLTLNNGVAIPCFGFGAACSTDDEMEALVKEAVQAGYRHFDTASAYGNERGVGRGILGSGLPREELFVTTKLWITDHGYERALAAFDESLARLGLDYVDLYLVHWPVPRARYHDWQASLLETWGAFEEIYHSGRARAVGVSNFTPRHLAHLLDHAKLAPAVNQMEFHPGFAQFDILRMCAENDICMQAWSPLAQGKILQSPQLSDIAAHYQRSVAQLCLRWVVQHGVLPLVLSKSPQRMRESAEIFNFTISAEDMLAIDATPGIIIGPHPENGYMHG